MAERVDISKLGGNEHDLNRTSVIFLKDKAPMHIAFNNYVMESEFDELALVKENGNSRPFLVIDHPELHAKVAIYLTSSIDEERMKKDNEIRGEHLFETPFALMNYISKSSVTGKVDDGKMSVIDRDRFFFITDDWIDEKSSRAKGYGEFKIGLSAHARNLREIDETLSKDLSRNNYTQIVTESPGTELWVYRMGAQRPMNYHPSAQYLMLALNMMTQFKNERKNLSSKSLVQMGNLAGEIANAYSEYLDFLDRVKQLELKNEKLYKSFIQTRYWSQQVSERMDKNLRNNIKGFGLFNKLNSHRFIYGRPKHQEGASVDDIITQEFKSVGIGETKIDGELKISQRAIIKNLLARERALYTLIANTTQEVVGFLNKINNEERINLSSFAYNKKFWTRFYDNYDKFDYIKDLANDFVVKYRKLSQEKKKSDAEKQTQIQVENRDKKQRELKQKQSEKVRKEKIALLEKKINNYYLEQFSKAFKLFEQGKLVSPDAELLELTKSSVDKKVDYSKLEIGAKLATRFKNELIGMKKMSKQFTEIVKIAKRSESKLTNLEDFNEDENNMILLMQRISDVEEKVNKQNKKLSSKERSPILKAQIHEMIMSLPEEELNIYISDDFGKSGEELLKCIQDIYHARTTIKSYNSIKNSKIAVLNALKEINDSELIKNFKLSQEAVGELQSKGIILPVDLTALSIEEINARIAKAESVLKKKTPTQEDYRVVEQLLQTETTKIRKFTEFSKKLLESRTSYIAKLNEYAREMQKVLPVTFRVMEKLVEGIDAEVKASFETTEFEGLKKDKNGNWVNKKDPTEVISDQELKDIVERFKNSTKLCLDYKNYCNPDADKAVVKALFDKLFPSAEQLMLSTRQSIGNSKSIDEAISHYKQAEKLIDSLVKEKDQFMALVRDKYDSILHMEEELLTSSQSWGYLMREEGKAIVRQVTNSNFPEPVKNAILKAVDNLCNSEQEGMVKETEEYKGKFRKRVLDLINAYVPRTQVYQPMEHYLTKSVAKNMAVNSNYMPKSISGANGLVERFRAYVESKGRQCNILSEIIARKVSGRYKASEVDAINKKSHNLITKAIDEEMLKAQKIDLMQEILIIKESLREFAKLSKSDFLYVNSPKGLEAYIKRQKNKDKSSADIRCSFKKAGSKSMIYGVDYFNFYEEVLKMLPEVRKTIADDNKYSAELYGVKLVGSIDPDWVSSFMNIREGEVVGKRGVAPYLESEIVEDGPELQEKLKEIKKLVRSHPNAKDVIGLMPNLAKLLSQFDDDNSEQS